MLLSNRTRLVGTLATICTFPFIFGCQGNLVGHRIIARFGDHTIDEDQYISHLERVNQNEINKTLALASRQTDATLDAGGVALITMLRDTGVDQLAAQKGVTPSPQDVDQLLSYQRLLNPMLDKELKSGTIVEEDVKQLIRMELEEFGIGTDGAKVDDKELQKAFETEKATLDVSPKIGMRVLGVKDDTDGQLRINKLKADGDFKAAEREEKAPPPIDGSEQFFETDKLQKTAPALYEATKTLNPGQIAPAPIHLTMQTAAGPQPFTVVAQLTQKLPASKVSLEQVRPILTQEILSKKYPEFNYHFLQVLSTFMQAELPKAEIYVDRYKPVVAAYLLAPPPMMSPSGAPSGNQQSPPMGGNAPPTGNPAPGMGGR